MHLRRRSMGPFGAGVTLPDLFGRRAATFRGMQRNVTVKVEQRA